MKRFKKGDPVWFVPLEAIFERGIGNESRFGRLAIIVGEPKDEKHDYLLRFEYRSSALVGANDNELAPMYDGAACEFDHLAWNLKQ